MRASWMCYRIFKSSIPIAKKYTDIVSTRVGDNNIYDIAFIEFTQEG